MISAARIAFHLTTDEVTADQVADARRAELARFARLSATLPALAAAKPARPSGPLIVPEGVQVTRLAFVPADAPKASPSQFGSIGRKRKRNPGSRVSPEMEAQIQAGFREGKTNREIADAVGVSDVTVGSRRRALAAAENVSHPKERFESNDLTQVAAAT